MAIKRLDPKATFEIVSVYDDALLFETPEELEELKKAKALSRYEKYMESFDISDLKFKDDQKPTLFKVRCLLASESAELDEKHQEFNLSTKTISYKNRNAMMIEIFKMACLGILGEDGKLEKLSHNDIEYRVVVDIGAMISLLGTLGKNLKKS